MAPPERPRLRALEAFPIQQDGQRAVGLGPAAPGQRHREHRRRGESRPPPLAFHLADPGSALSLALGEITDAVDIVLAD